VECRYVSISTLREQVFGFWGEYGRKAETDRRALPGVEPVALIDSTWGNLPGPDIVRIDKLRALSLFYGWWYMAVLSWWSDLSG
jgi:hypothetical protein